MSDPVTFPIFRTTDPVLALGAARQLQQQRSRPIHSSSGTLLQRLDEE